MRRMKAVWWARLEPDQYGKFSFDDPVEIKCRWEDKADEFRNSEGQMEASTATVYVDRIMKNGDKLKRGELDSETPDDPSDDLLAFEIQAFEQFPNFRCREIMYVAHL